MTRDAMTKPTVYVETSVVSYAVARPSRIPLIAGRQDLTRRWWEQAIEALDLHISYLVRDEARSGDSETNHRRLALIEALPLLEITSNALALAESLVGNEAIPDRNKEDALHVALAAVHGMDYLVTWNFKHIHNVVRRSAVEAVCENNGYGCPHICSPEEFGDFDL